jgi:hypothetical protein
MSRATKRLAKALRRTWLWRAMWSHFDWLTSVDPAGGATNARCWSSADSNLRAVYGQVVGCKRSLPPLVCGVHLKQRRVVYTSLTGCVEVHTRPRDGCAEGLAAMSCCDPAPSRRVAVWDGNALRFVSPVPGPWTRLTWSLERGVFRAIEWVNDRIVVRSKRRSRHAKRNDFSRALYRF